MKAQNPTDYSTYKEIMDELLRPIQADGLDFDTLKRLYESKLVYLENLRVKCFYEMNGKGDEAFFSTEDYQIILRAIMETHNHLKDLIVTALSGSLEIQYSLRFY